METAASQFLRQKICRIFPNLLMLVTSGYCSLGQQEGKFHHITGVLFILDYCQSVCMWFLEKQIIIFKTA